MESKWFNNSKGYGFISKDGGTDIFVHCSAIQGEGYKKLQEGDKVGFEIIHGQKGLQGNNVIRDETEPVDAPKLNVETTREQTKEVHSTSPAPSVSVPATTPGEMKCPECGISMKVDRLRRHRRRAHWLLLDHQSARKIFVDILARELCIKIEPILEYLEELSYPYFPSYAIDGVVADKVRVHFGKATELETKLTKQEQVPPQHSVSSTGIPVERFSFRLLPPGTWDMGDVIAYYRREAHRFPKDVRDRGIDWSRFESIKSLRPDKCYVGDEQWLGYVVFEFPGSERVVLECPVIGNATYVLWGDWQRMVTHPKSYIWSHFSGSYHRILHTNKGKWFTNTKSALKPGKRAFKKR